jgi:CheY-like chemotaxis protein
LVDDRWAARTSLAAILELIGYQVLEAEDGIQAHGILASMHFDAMVLDIRLPGMDGATLLAAVPDPPPTVILSATELGVHARQRLGAVVVAELRKPVAPQLLIDAVAAAVSGGMDAA